MRKNIHQYLGFNLLSLVTVLLFCATTYAQPSQYDLPTTQDIVNIDGVMDEALWQNALLVDLPYENAPGDNTPAPVKTEGYLIADNKNLYVAFKAYVPEGEKVKSFRVSRDEFVSQDLVGITIDPYGQGRLAYEIFTNAYGNQIDLSRTPDDPIGNFDFNMDWQAKGQLTDFGYIIELAIPFSSIPTTNNQYDSWHFNLFRYYPENVMHVLLSMPEDRNNACYFCQLPKLNIQHEIQANTLVTITPSMIMQHNQNRQPQQNWHSENDDNLGLDVRWKINASNTANLTINPDFSQIEADQPQLTSNDTFTQNLAEKRHFFLENSDYFLNDINIIHSRNISSPDHGIKFTGKIGSHRYGLITAQDSVTNFIVPGLYGDEKISLKDNDNGALTSQANVFRYANEFDQSLILGLTATQKTADNYHNKVRSLDGQWRPGDSHRFKFQYVDSQTQQPENPEDTYANELSGKAYFVNYAFNNKHWNFYINQQKYDEDFRADLGFVTQVGIKQNESSLEHIFYNDNDKLWNKFYLQYLYFDKNEVSGNPLLHYDYYKIRFDGIMQSALQYTHYGKEETYYNKTYSLAFDELYFYLKPYANFDIDIAFKKGDEIERQKNEKVKKEVKQFYSSWHITENLTFIIYFQQEKLQYFGRQISKEFYIAPKIKYQFDDTNQIKISYFDWQIKRDEIYFTDTEITDTNLLLENKMKYFEFLYTYKLTPKTLFYAGVTHSAYQDDTQQWMFPYHRNAFIKMSYAWQP